MLNNPLTFEDAVVVGLSTTPTEDDQPYEELEIQVGLTPAISGELGVHDLVYLDNDVVRSTWTTIGLDTVYTDVRVSTPSKHDGAELSIAPNSIKGFKIKRNKKSGSVKLSFTLVVDGYAEVFAQFVTAVGTGPFRLEVVPLQENLGLTEPGAEEQEESFPITDTATEGVPWDEEPAPEARATVVEMPTEASDKTRLTKLTAELKGHLGMVKWDRLAGIAKQRPELKGLIAECLVLRAKLGIGHSLATIQ
jgi:hypothetical protein